MLLLANLLLHTHTPPAYRTPAGAPVVQLCSTASCRTYLQGGSLPGPLSQSPRCRCTLCLCQLQAGDTIHA
jgi:hypothetical protein